MNNIQKISVIVGVGCLLASLILSQIGTKGFIVINNSYTKSLGKMELMKKYPFDTWQYDPVNREAAQYSQERLLEKYNFWINMEAARERTKPTGERVVSYQAHIPTIIPLSLLLLCGLTFYLYKDD